MASQKYTSASQHLLRYAELNREDNLFARRDDNHATRDGTIVYIFDTGVIESYWQRDPSSSAGRYGTDALLHDDIAKYSGWIALKFLIEHRLPGQRDTGFISPNHWNEAIARVEEAEAEVRRDFARLGASTNLDSVAIEGALHELSSFSEQPDKLLKAAEERNVKDIFTKIMHAVSLGERVRRVFRTGRGGQESVRDLTLCPFYDQIPGPKMRHQDFRRWQAVIAKHRKEQEREHGRTESSTKRTESDAITLAIIQMMYRATAPANGPDASVRFVFVSADRALHSAFEELGDYLKDARIPHFIRHPHVYAPLLNHATMASAQAANTSQYKQLKDVMDRVEEALEPLIANYDPDSHLTQAYDIRLQHNVNNWSRTVETLCLSDSHYVLSDLSGDYIPAKNLARILSAPSVRVAAANAVGGDIREIRDAHLQMMSVQALETIEKAYEHRLSDARYRDAPHRAPVKLIGVDIAAELGYPDVGQAGQSAWLEELLRRFRQGHSGDTKVSIIDRMKQHWDDPSHAAAVQLLASCIFFAVNSWDSARLCAKLCLAHVQDKKHRKLWMREARYCEALAIRMQLSSRAQINDAINFLNKNMANQPDKLAMMRDGVERSTLILTAAIVQKIEDGLPVIDTQTPFIALLPVDGLEAEVAEALAELEEILVQDGRSNDKPLSETSERILLQAQINVLGASIFAKTVGMPIPVHYGEHEKLQEAVRGLRSRIKASNIKPSMTANIYLLAGQALLEPLQINVEAVLALLRSIDPKDNSLTRADIREIVYLANHFENLANSPSSVGDVNSPSLK